MLGEKRPTMAENIKKHNEPVFKKRAGALDVAAWKNESETGEYLTFSFQRGYKDKLGEWQSTQSLRQQDLLVLAHLLTDAYAQSILKE